MKKLVAILDSNKRPTGTYQYGHQVGTKNLPEFLQEFDHVKHRTGRSLVSAINRMNHGRKPKVILGMDVLLNIAL